jgi:hypothetical protein
LQLSGDTDEANPQSVLNARPTRFYFEIQTMPVEDWFRDGDASGARPFTFLLYLVVAIAPAFVVGL